MTSPDRTPDCDDWWTNCCCSPLGYVFCCRRMRKSSKTQMLWGWLLLAVVASCSILGGIVYQPDTPYATPSDMRPVINNFHPLFCAAAEITSPNSVLTFDAYLIKGELRTDTVDRQFYESKSAFYVDAKEFYYFTFYLLKESIVTMRHCPKSFLTFYVFRGEENFKAWQMDNYCEDCYMFKRYLFDSIICDVFEMNIADEDEYFYVYSNDRKTGTWVDIQVKQNRSIYDLGDASPVCSDVYTCGVAVNSLEDRAVFQVNGYYNLDGNSHPVFTTKCVPRIWSYVVIHGLIAVIIGTIGTIIISKCCKDNRMVLPDRQTDERTSLINSQVPPSYSSVTLTPPKYEDIEKEFDKDLPSYSDVLASNIRGDDCLHIQIRNSVASNTSGEIEERNQERTAQNSMCPQRELDNPRTREPEHANVAIEPEHANVASQNCFYIGKSQEQGASSEDFNRNTSELTRQLNDKESGTVDTVVEIKSIIHSSQDS